MDTSPILPVITIHRHRLTTDGTGVTTLVGAYGCPLQCRYCINAHAWNPATLPKCTCMTPASLYEKVKTDALYFLATGGGITFGGGEALLHADFIRAFRDVCGPEWSLTVETSLNVPTTQLEKVLDVVNDYIVDIKDMNPAIYEAYTGVCQDRMLANLSFLIKKVSPEHILVRVPFIPDYNTEADQAHSVALLKDMGFTDIETFPYVIRG